MYTKPMQKPLAGIDVNLLVALDALLTEENVASAARSIGLSPSAMSHALARLRDLLGDPVLVRSGQRMMATPRARAMAGPVRQGLALLSSAVAPPAAFDPAAAREVVRIGAIDFAMNQVLPSFLEVLRKEAPLVDVAVAGLGPSSFDALRAGELHLIFAIQRTDSGFESLDVGSEDYVSVVRRGHPVLRRKVTPEGFAALTHVIISVRLQRVGPVDKALGALGLSRRVGLAIPSLGAAALAVSQSDMVLTGARREVERLAAGLPLQTFPPPLPIPPFELSLYWHERLSADPFHGWIRQKLMETANREGLRTKR